MAKSIIAILEILEKDTKMTLHKDTIFAELCSLSADQMEDMIEVLHNSRIPIYAPALLSWAEDALLELRDEENEE